MPLFMVENQPGQEYGTDDLDLMNLLERSFSFFKRYGKRIAIFSMAGMLAGVVLYLVSPKNYASTLLLHSSTLTNTEQINIIENWNALLKNKEYVTLGKRFNCEPEMLQKVVKITAAEIQKLYIPNNPNGFVVTAIVKDNNVLDSLAAGMMYGFESSDYIKLRLTRRRATLIALADKVRTEISKLDSTKKNIEYSINNQSQHASSFIIDISSINAQMIGLNEKLLSYQDELKFANAVEVYHKFESFEKPASPKLVKLLVLGFIAGFAMGYLSSVYDYLRSKFAGRASRMPV